MATTIRGMIKGALQKLQVIGAGVEPEAADAADCLVILNKAMHGMKIRGINIDWRDLTINDDAPLPPEDIQGFEYLLAIEFAPVFGREVDPAVATGAADSLVLFQAKYKDNIPRQDFDPALRARGYGDFAFTRG